MAPGLTTYQQAFFTKSYNALPLGVKPDIATAKKLIAQAHAEGTKVTLAGLAGGSTDIVAAELQQAGQSIGLNVNVLKLPSSDFFAESFSGKEPRTYDGLMNFWEPDYPDPSAPPRTRVRIGVLERRRLRPGLQGADRPVGEDAERQPRAGKGAG